MSTTANAADTEKSDRPAARPEPTLEPTRPEDERPDTEGDRRVGDIDDLPRPDWNDTPENARRSLREPVDRP